MDQKYGSGRTWEVSVGQSWVYDAVLSCHVLAAFATAAAITVTAVCLEAAVRRDDAGQIALLLTIARQAARVVAYGLVATAGFGLWLVPLGHWGFGTPWVVIGIVLTATVTALGAVGGHRPKRARLLAADLTRDGKPPTPHLRELLADPVANAINYLSVVLMLGIIVIMITKPG